MKTQDRLTMGDRLRIKRFLERMDWAFRLPKESVLAVQVIKRMFYKVSDYFLDEPEVEAILLNLFALMEVQPLDSRRKEEGIVLLKKLYSFYELDGVGLSIKGRERNGLGRTDCD